MEGIRHRRKGKEDNVVFQSVESDSEKVRDALPTWSSILFLSAVILLLKLALVERGRLPQMLTVKDETVYTDRFIGERARNSLLKLESIGPKLTGSYECEVTAVRVLREEVEEIARSSKQVHLLQADLQRPKGSFPLGLKPHGFNSMYENIQNFAVRIGPRIPSNHSVLVNCHYDTVPDSPGASDNGLNCAVMLEVLRKLSQRSQPLKHNIIFLFNGAEEQLLQGSHGFITSHHWHKEVRAVVNLDAGGAGGRETMFQATADHPWLIQLYARTVPHPCAALAAQEIFDAGLIPSDTDYRIFRDVGKLPAIDMAHGDNGYIYHTRLDTMDYIAPGVYQHTGDNILALLLELSQTKELEDTEKARVDGAKLVFFDVFNTFMITYCRSTGIAVNIVVVALTILSAILGLSRLNGDAKVSAVVALRKSLLSTLAGLIAIVAVIFLLDGVGAALSWYPRPYYILALYAFPYVAAALISWTLLSNSGGFESALQYFFGGQLLTATVLFLITLAGIRSSYLIMAVLLPASIVGLLTSSVKSARTRLVLLTSSSLLGLSIFLEMILTLYLVLIPVLGRSGVLANPEVRIGGVTFITCFVFGNSLMPLLACVKEPRLVSRALALVFLVVLGMIIFTPLGFPYSANPKYPALNRFYLYHTQQTQYDSNGAVIYNNSGIFILPMDRNGMKYVSDAVPALKQAVPASCPPDRLLCLFPLYNSRYIAPAKTSLWLPFSQPYLQYPTALQLVESHEVGNFGRRLKFRIKGPDHMTLIVSPRDDIALKNWTLNKNVQAAHYDGRQYYVVFISDGLFGNTRDFEIYLEAEERIEAAWLDISVVGHYQHQKTTYTLEFSQIMNQFPDWTQATAWLTFVQAYSF